MTDVRGEERREKKSYAKRCLAVAVYASEKLAGGALRHCLVRIPKSKKLLQYLLHRMFAARAWSIKCRRKEKLIAQFGGKLRDERFEPN